MKSIRFLSVLFGLTCCLTSGVFGGTYTITQITNNTYNDNSVQINDNGEMVWSGYDGTDHEIYMYDGASITQLTDNPYYDFSPQINGLPT